MNDIGNAVGNVASNIANAPINVITNVSKDITSTAFYKSPVFYTFVLYVGLLICIYFYFRGAVLTTYLFGKNKNMGILDLFEYPYGVKEPENIIKTFVSNPFIIYGLLFTILYPSFMDVKKPGNQPYFYAAIMSTIMIIFLFLIHVAIVKYIVNAETIEVSDEYDINKTGNTYSQLYKGHWILLFVLSPLYAFTLVYMARKLG